MVDTTQDPFSGTSGGPPAASGSSSQGASESLPPAPRKVNVQDDEFEYESDAPFYHRYIQAVRFQDQVTYFSKLVEAFLQQENDGRSKLQDAFSPQMKAHFSQDEWDFINKMRDPSMRQENFSEGDFKACCKLFLFARPETIVNFKGGVPFEVSLGFITDRYVDIENLLKEKGKNHELLRIGMPYIIHSRLSMQRYLTDAYNLFDKEKEKEKRKIPEKQYDPMEELLEDRAGTKSQKLDLSEKVKVAAKTIVGTGLGLILTQGVFHAITGSYLIPFAEIAWLYIGCRIMKGSSNKIKGNFSKQMTSCKRGAHRLAAKLKNVSEGSIETLQEVTIKDLNMLMQVATKSNMRSHSKNPLVSKHLLPEFSAVLKACEGLAKIRKEGLQEDPSGNIKLNFELDIKQKAPLLERSNSQLARMFSSYAQIFLCSNQFLLVDGSNPQQKAAYLASLKSLGESLEKFAR